MSEDLPPLPEITLRVASDHTPSARATGGFLNLRRVDLVATYPDGSKSAPFPYDIATRASLDAVIVVAHFEDAGERFVFLRSAVRPPCALRGRPPEHEGWLWEVPAGLIDGDESPAETAARELEEELGFKVAPDALMPLGPWTFPAPGMCGERHVFLHVAVDDLDRNEPTEDGSALERFAAVIAVELDAAIEQCRRGNIRDAKTELALRRFKELA